MSNGTQTKTLTDFLLERIAEDENAAKSAGHGCGYLHQHNAGWVEVDLPAEHNVRPSYEMRFIRTFKPARVLAECSAKRAIVAQWEMTQPPASGADYAIEQELELALCHLAAVYADHSDYDPAWGMS